MLMQRSSRSHIDQDYERAAAMQHGFPKAVTQHGQTSRNPNLSFAAPEPSVSMQTKSPNASVAQPAAALALKSRLPLAGAAQLPQ